MQKERDYERQHHESALLKGPKNMIHGAPDVSTAAHVGQPNLNPPDDAVAASEVLKPNSGGVSGFTLSGSTSGSGLTDAATSSNSPGSTKQEDAVTSQGTIDNGPAPGRTLGVQIIQPPDASVQPSANTSAAAPAAAATEQPAATPATPPPTTGSADTSGASSTPGTSSAKPPSASTASNGQGAGTQPAQTDQSSADSSSSSTNGQNAAPAQSSSTDDSKDSTSKKKKGARKLIPW